MGRIVLGGNTGSHIVKLVNASDGTDVPSGSGMVSTAGQYRYTNLANAGTLSANTSYYLLSCEIGGGDTWYDFGAIAFSNMAAVNGPAYQDGNGVYNTFSLPGQAYVPVSFNYDNGNTLESHAPGQRILSHYCKVTVPDAEKATLSASGWSFNWNCDVSPEAGSDPPRKLLNT